MVRYTCIEKRPDGLTNLPPGKVDAKADAAPVGATNREMRRPSTDSLEGFFMFETTLIHPDKVRAYLATDYRIGHTSKDIVLTIGQRSERLAALFATNGVDCGAFLATARLAEAIRAAIAAGKAGSLSDGMQWLADQGRAATHEIKGAWWMDVDDPRAHALAEELAPRHLAAAFAAN